MRVFTSVLPQKIVFFFCFGFLGFRSKIINLPHREKYFILSLLYG